jgi:hypothetical protein
MNQPCSQLQIGTLSKVNQLALVPYSYDCPIILTSNHDHVALAFELCEALVLQLLQKQPVAQTLLYEAYPSRHFSQLKRLYAHTDSHYGLQLFNVREFSQHLVKLTDVAHKRFSLLARSHSDTLLTYNAKTTRTESIIYLLITDISPFVSESSVLQALQHLCLNAPQVGIIPILLHNKSLAITEDYSEFKRKAQESFWQSIKNHAFGFDLSDTPIKAFRQPAELWRLFAKFDLQLGISLALRQQWTDALIDKRQKAEADNPDTDFLLIPIGIDTTSGEKAYFCLGEASDAYHGMIGGAIRSGKSTLLNNLIVRACETYSPEELRLWLFDYKHGVEFGIFQELAHVDKLHIDDKDQQYALDAFIEFEHLMAERAELFRHCEPPVKRLVDYNQVADKPLPRCLMIIDEVQVLFQDPKTKRIMQNFLVNVSRQGAGYGLHFLFCTQSYQNVDLNPDVKAQFKLRIGLKLANSAECRALMGHDNDAPSTLAPYHTVYNNDYGNVGANRIMALDKLIRDEFLERLQALKLRYS